jgi:DNA-directed RNA polymerase beta' subunit
VCRTCHQASLFCPGHMGHISLPLPCYNPVTFRLMTKVCLVNLLSIYVMNQLFKLSFHSF